MNDLVIPGIIDSFHAGYVACMRWAEEFDDEFTSQQRFEILGDCMRFICEAWHLIKGLDLAQCGHDFWLSRNGHGSGFWDRGYPKSLSDELMRICHSFGHWHIN